jgi:hypothetical protein
VLPLAVAAFLATAGSASAAIDLNPEALELLLRDEKPATIELPTVTREVFHSLSHPNYGTEERSVVEILQRKASSAGHAIKEVARKAARDLDAEKTIKDCTKKGLQDTAWDLWWSSLEPERTFNPKAVFEKSTLECFESSLVARAGFLGELAKLIANEIGHSAEESLERDYDVAGLADWLQVVDYYYVAY